MSFIERKFSYRGFRENDIKKKIDLFIKWLDNSEFKELEMTVSIDRRDSTNFLLKSPSYSTYYLTITGGTVEAKKTIESKFRSFTNF